MAGLCGGGNEPTGSLKAIYFDYVVITKEKERVAFGSSAEREVLPLRHGVSRFACHYTSELLDNISPAKYNTSEITSAFNAIKTKVVSKRGIGGVAATAPRFKYEVSTTPSPLTYNLLSPGRQAVAYLTTLYQLLGYLTADEIGDSETIFGEMRPRIRHRLPCIHITVGENLGKNQPDDEDDFAACLSFEFLCFRFAISFFSGESVAIIQRPLLRPREDNLRGPARSSATDFGEL
ncbi:hypothetical protein ANN_17525 [Periplaneta americana]|uniref:Uncharacterized protein n=1 Tax=Periplaneta americana TaxID=6978 RepID=A0ABQ8ST74_PERAM|nr:hypothetical protein ANN_17525 [Periplaneta americana]